VKAWLLAALSQWQEHARNGWRPHLRQWHRGRAPGLVAVLLFSFTVLFGSYRASERYYDKHLLAADTSYYVMSASLLVSGKHDFGLKRVLRDPAPFHSSDNGTGVYVLQTLTAWYLRAFLPLRPAMAVILNGVWYVAMAISLYTLLWSRIKSWTTCALLTVAYLVINPFLATLTYGLTAVDPNLVGYMLGTSVLCCTVLSDRFQRLVPCVFVGIFLGCLCLGRVYTLGLLGPAMLPYVAACFWRRSWEEIAASLRGGLLALGIAALICGWFVIGNWRIVLAYPTQYGTAGVLNHASLSEGLRHWLAFPRSILAKNVVLVCVLSWPLALSLARPGRRWRDFNWSATWAAVAPLLVLAKMGTTFEPYGAVALFGVFVVSLFPFDRPASAIFHRGWFAAMLWLACAANTWTFFRDLQNEHEPGKDAKEATVAALKAMRDDATSAGKQRVALGLVHWGVVHDAAVIDSLLFDVGVRVATPGYKAKRRPSSPLIVEPIMTDPWAWDRAVKGDAAITAKDWAATMEAKADYVLVLWGGASRHRRHGRWAPWVDASDKLLKSPVFRPLGSPFNVPGDGPLQLLVRQSQRTN